MKLSATLLFFLLLLVCASCISYTKALTTTGPPDADFFATELKPGKMYRLKLKSDTEFTVKVTSIKRDSLYGTFYFMQGSRRVKMRSSVSLGDITDVKAGRISVVPTVLVIAVPVGLVILAIRSITFNFGPEFTF